MKPAAAPRSLARLLITGSPALPAAAGGALPGPSAGAQRLRRPRRLGGAPARRAGAAPAAGLAAARHTPSLPLSPHLPTKPPVTLAVARSQGLPAFLQAGRTHLLKPSAGGCAHQTASTKADGGSCSSCSSPTAWDPALWLVGLGWTPSCRPHGRRSPRMALRLASSPQNPCGGMNPHTSWPLKQSQGSADCGPYMGKADPDLGEHKLNIISTK